METNKKTQTSPMNVNSQPLNHFQLQTKSNDLPHVVQIQLQLPTQASFQSRRFKLQNFKGRLESQWEVIRIFKIEQILIPSNKVVV
jgi:hypothetical protein